MTRYIPPPLPVKSDAQRELNEALSKLNELQDELEMVRISGDKKEQQLHRREKELEALRKVLKDEVSSHDRPGSSLFILSRILSELERKIDKPRGWKYTATVL